MRTPIITNTSAILGTAFITLMKADWIGLETKMNKTGLKNCDSLHVLSTRKLTMMSTKETKVAALMSRFVLATIPFLGPIMNRDQKTVVNHTTKRHTSSTIKPAFTPIIGIPLK